MGILNITPDSFSDGGRYPNVETAVRRALEMVNEGATIIDVGGESTRPGFTPVSAEEESRRAIPVIETLRKNSPGMVISIDTSKASVAEKALEAGANIVNDVHGLRDSDMVEVVRRYHAGAVIMHNAQCTMHNIAEQVAYELSERVKDVERTGIPRDTLCLDPGFGFGKRGDENWALLRGLKKIVDLGYPVLVGGSRKHFIPSDNGSVNFAIEAIRQGARIVRVHDVRETIDATQRRRDFST